MAETKATGASGRKAVEAALRTVLFGLIILLLWVLSRRQLPGYLSLLCVLMPMVCIPVVWLGRLSIDRNPALENVRRISTVVHAVLMVLYGFAIIEALKTGETWRGWTIPVPPGFSWPLVVLTGWFCLLTVINLALRGLGAPFAVALSRRLATDWLYKWTRNPMVLGVLLWLLSAGLYLQSLLFVVWVLSVFAPSIILFIKVFEERELEIRFGDSYREYRKKTAFLWPRSPRPGG